MPLKPLTLTPLTSRLFLEASQGCHLTGSQSPFESPGTRTARPVDLGPASSSPSNLLSSRSRSRLPVRTSGALHVLFRPWGSPPRHLAMAPSLPAALCSTASSSERPSGPRGWKLHTHAFSLPPPPSPSCVCSVRIGISRAI